MEDIPGAPLVAVIILNWNKAALTAACVAAVTRMTYQPVLILVIDNGSAAGSLGPLEALEAPFELMRNQANLGFTGGVNTGIRRALEAGADYIWLLNNDAVPAADTLATLVSAMQADPHIGMTSPIIRNSDANDEVDFCGSILNGTAIEVTSDLA
ncbi:MAG TPA: glycosyltransferase, partial [Devosia sp.]|nr:glycosyltransferase [Devosia sp.]